MNSKVSFVNFKYLIENFKKSKGIILVLSLLIPVFTILSMLVLNSTNGKAVLQSLSELSVPAIMGMYVIPFIIAATLFSFIFKKDSVDFVNALPIDRKTLYVTNIVGGIIIFTLVFAFTAILMAIFSTIFINIIIAPKMYLYYFITFLVTYIYVFVVSTLSLSFTGSKVVHIVITLIILFIPGFLSDLYMSRMYDQNYARGESSDYVNCSSEKCPELTINNELSIDKSLEITNGQTLPYKYISEVPRMLLDSSHYEVNYGREQRDVYNFESVLKMIMLSAIYFILGLYVFNKRKMEMAESSFQDEDTHHLVKCIMMLPVTLVFISVYLNEKEISLLLILTAITITIYVIYDLITRKNNVKIRKSFLYLLGLFLSSILLFFITDSLANLEGSKKIEKLDVSNVGIDKLYYSGFSTDQAYSIIDYKISNNKIIDFIFDNVNKNIKIDGSSVVVPIRFTLKNNKSYYFNITLSNKKYEELVNLLSLDKGYSNRLKDINIDDLYAVSIRNNNYTKEDSEELVNLIKKYYKDVDIKDIMNNKEDKFNYHFYDINLYMYDGTTTVTHINGSLINGLTNYVINLQNSVYIREMKNEKTQYSADIYIQILTTPFENDIYNNNVNLVDENREIFYNFVNKNIKDKVDLVNHSTDDYATFSVTNFTNYYSNDYYVFVLKDDNYNKMIEQVEKNTEEYINRQSGLYDKEVK